MKTKTLCALAPASLCAPGGWAAAGFAPCPPACGLLLLPAQNPLPPSHPESSAKSAEGIALREGGSTSAQPVMIVVPDSPTVSAEVSIANQDIGFVNAGQKAEVKLETFPYTKYGTVYTTARSACGLYRDHGAQRPAIRAEYVCGLQQGQPYLNRWYSGHQ